MHPSFYRCCIGDERAQNHDTDVEQRTTKYSFPNEVLKNKQNQSRKIYKLKKINKATAMMLSINGNNAGVEISKSKNEAANKEFADTRWTLVSTPWRPAREEPNRFWPCVQRSKNALIVWIQAFSLTQVAHQNSPSRPTRATCVLLPP